tara:strand:- start:930 stop:1463 length:534 start_codon:yes stop_codon:yes gene_type:complete
MTRPEIVVCVNDKPAVIDLSSIQDICPPILGRFLGISGPITGNCFKEPNRDDQGRLTFVKDFEICRSSFQACITFIKTGYVDSIDVLVRTMDILGGSKKLDAYVSKKQAEIEARDDYILEKEMLSRSNPMTPEADTSHLFTWKIMHNSWGPGLASDEWSVTERVVRSLDFWWRKRRK